MDADRFLALRSKLNEKCRTLRSLEKAQHRSSYENKRLRDLLEEPRPGVESLARAVDSELVGTTQEIDKTGRAADNLHD